MAANITPKDVIKIVEATINFLDITLLGEDLSPSSSMDRQETVERLNKLVENLHFVKSFDFIATSTHSNKDQPYSSHSVPSKQPCTIINPPKLAIVEMLRSKLKVFIKMPATELRTHANYSGLLRKCKKQLISKWNRRFCVLCDGILFYFEAETDTRSKGYMILGCYNFSSSPQNNAFTFKLESLDRTTAYTFQADQKKDIDGWKEQLVKVTNQGYTAEEMQAINAIGKELGSNDDDNGVAVDDTDSTYGDVAVDDDDSTYGDVAPPDTQPSANLPPPVLPPARNTPAPQSMLPPARNPPHALLPGQLPPGQLLPGQLPPGQLLPGQLLPGQLLPGQRPPGQLLPGQLLPGQLLPGQLLPGQLPPGQLLPGQLPPGQLLPGQLLSGQLPPGVPVETPAQQTATPQPEDEDYYGDVLDVTAPQGGEELYEELDVTDAVGAAPIPRYTPNKGSGIAPTVSPYVPTSKGSSDFSIANIYMGQYDCSSDHHQDLAFKRGDILYILEKIDANWWMGFLHGKVGLVPRNFLTEAFTS